MYYQKVKEEERGAGTVGQEEDTSWELERVSVEARDGRRGTVGELPDDAGMSSGPARSELKPEITELRIIRAMAPQLPRRPQRPDQCVCWGCAQPGHLVRDCPSPHAVPGNAIGPTPGGRRGL